MKKLISMVFLMAVFFVSSSTAYAEPPDFVWAAQAGGAEWDIAYAIATDRAGNSIVTGYFADTATFGDTTLTAAGGCGMFIAKYDSTGKVLWLVGADGTDDIAGRDIATDSSDNIMVIGGFCGTATIGDSTFVSHGHGDVFIAKYDEDGNFLWAAKAGGADIDNPIGIATDDSGNVIGTGSFIGTSTFGDTTLTSVGSLDIFAAKYSGAGNFLWAARAGGASLDFGWAVATDDSGSSLVTGYFRGTATFGDTTLVSAGVQDVFIAKYDRAGDLLWAVQAGRTAGASGYGIATDGSGNIIVTGELGDSVTFGDTTLVSTGGYDIFIAKCDGAGNFLWAARAGGTLDDAGWDVVTDGSGNVIVTGCFKDSATFGDTTLTSEGNLDIFAAKYDEDGDFLWVAQAGGPSEDGGFGIAVDDSGNPVVAGYFSYEATFGDTTLVSAGEYDIFVAKLGAGPTGIEGEFARSQSSHLSQNYPNPFKPTTSLRFWVAPASGGGFVSLKIYDISGREVRTLVNERKTPGSYTVVWDGRSDDGVQVSSGVYFYRLEAGGFVQTHKMLLIR